MNWHRRTALAILSLLLLGALPMASALATRQAILPPLSSGKLKQRFDVLSQRHSNECGLSGVNLDKLAVNGRLQGACCGPMRYTDYVRQVNGLKAYADVSDVPPDPYDIPVSLAKHLISLDTAITLNAAQQKVYDQAKKLADEHGPCCCRCWRYTAFRGQAKELISERGYSASQIAKIWDLEDGCGSGNMTTMGG